MHLPVPGHSEWLEFEPFTLRNSYGYHTVSIPDINCWSWKRNLKPLKKLTNHSSLICRRALSIVPPVSKQQGETDHGGHTRIGLMFVVLCHCQWRWFMVHGHASCWCLVLARGRRPTADVEVTSRQIFCLPPKWFPITIGNSTKCTYRIRCKSEIVSRIWMTRTRSYMNHLHSMLLVRRNTGLIRNSNMRKLLEFECDVLGPMWFYAYKGSNRNHTKQFEIHESFSNSNIMY